jgi:solute carrier family 25 (mitochondrial phosphate transporter), member 23/24/25/41
MASTCTAGQGPSKREIFDASFTGAQERPWIPRLRSDPPAFHPVSHNLSEFRIREGNERERRLRRLWRSLPKNPKVNHDESEDRAIADRYSVEDDHSLTPESAKRLQEMYNDELFARFLGKGFLHRTISWDDFERYAENKEAGKCLSCLPCLHDN